MYLLQLVQALTYEAIINNNNHGNDDNKEHDTSTNDDNATRENNELSREEENADENNQHVDLIGLHYIYKQSFYFFYLLTRSCDDTVYLSKYRVLYLELKCSVQKESCLFESTCKFSVSHNNSANTLQLPAHFLQISLSFKFLRKTPNFLGSSLILLEHNIN